MKKGPLLFLVGLVTLFLFPAVAQAQEDTRTITGTVTSADDGTPLPGANVVVKGTTTGTATDPQGHYELDVPPAADSLIFSFIGYVQQTVPINERAVIDVALEPSAQALQEVVVVGYGTQIKEKVTGSIASVTADDIENAPVTTMGEALQGRVAGVFVAGSGKLGQGLNIDIRGAASVTAGSQPLYVIDGMPVTNMNLSGNDAETNPMAQLDMSDIASIDILKGAAAAAIYGARASNGVILITTKSGLATGETQVSVNLRRSWSGPTHTPDMMNAEEYVNYYLEAARNRGIWEWEHHPENWVSKQAAIDYYVNGKEEGITEIFDLYAQGTNWRQLDVNAPWMDEIFRNDAGGINFDLSARGGNDKTRFYLSGSLNKQNGILIRDNYNQLSGLVNLDHDVSDRLSVGAKLNLIRVFHTRIPYDNSFATPVQLIAQLPISPVYAPDTTVATVKYVNGEGPKPGKDCVPGEYAEKPSVDCYYKEYVPTERLNRDTYYFNNLLYKDNARYETRIFRALANAYVELDLLPGLTFRGRFGLDVLDQNEDQYYNSKVYQNTGALHGRGINTWDRVANYNVDGYFTYTEAFAEVHDLEVTTGMSYQSVTRDGAMVVGEDFPNDSFSQIDSAAEIVGGGSYETGYRFLSYFARANYSYDDKYLFKISGRFQGSSRFGRENQYGFFPTASAGWILTEESFLDDSDVVSFLKLRAGLGLTGNANIGNFPALGLWSAAGYAGRSGTVPEQMSNPRLKWERALGLDVGIDFGLFRGRINGVADFYFKKTRDLLLDVNVPSTTGFLIQTRNVGKLKNWGFEFLINTDNVVGPFSWSTGLNFSMNRNKITDLNGQVITDGFFNRAIEGEPLGVFYGYEYAGVDPKTGDALYYVNEKDENGNIIDPEATTTDPNEANQVVVGNPWPAFIGGFRNHFSYKGLTLDVFFQFVNGNEIYDGGGVYKSSNARYLDRQHASQLDAWQEPGDVTDVPEARFRLRNGVADSDRWLYDGSYLRLKNVTLAYNLPEHFTQWLKIDRARIYLIGTNLLTFSSYPWFDPESVSDYGSTNVGRGGVFYTAPQARSITGGIEFSF